MCSNSYLNHYIKVGQLPKCMVSCVESTGQLLMKRVVSSSEICTNQGKYYSIPVKNALDIITKGYIELRAHETEETKEIIDNIEEGVQLLWQFSR